VGLSDFVKKPDNAHPNLQTHHIPGSTVGLWEEDYVLLPTTERTFDCRYPFSLALFDAEEFRAFYVTLQG
jgi:hypothetical protein